MRQFKCRTHGPECNYGFETNSVSGYRTCKEVRRLWVERNKSRRGAQISEWGKRNKDKRNASRARYVLKNKEKVLGKDRERNRRLKLEMVARYGSHCQCCGETNPAFLTLDHVNDDGKEHRKTTGHGYRFYCWLQKNGWPLNGLALSCFNCNCGRRVNGGICPHKEIA